LKNPSGIESKYKNNTNSMPFFSIGVTTYNRPELLKQTLTSIREQSYADFEVIVGNDYIQEPISSVGLGVGDPRIRFVNHPRNLGEVRNMNALMDLSRGRYFTWLTDDDLYAPNFLAEVRLALIKFGFPACVFTSFEHIQGTGHPAAAENVAGSTKMLSGRRFLRMYWSGELKAMGCTAVYDKAYLKRLGGVESLSETTFALYSEHLLLVQAGLLDKVVHIDRPLVRYRVHEGSWGCSAKDLMLYKQASQNLVSKSIDVFCKSKLRKDFGQNMTSVLEFTATDFFNRIRSCKGLLNRLEVVPYLISLNKPLRSLKGSRLYWNALISWGCIGVRMVWWLTTKFDFKAAAAQAYLKLRRMSHSFLGHREKGSGA
jgi:hypothetical protein